MIRFISTILVLFVAFTGLFGQNEKYTDSIFDSQLRTVVFYKSGNINTLPVIALNNPDETLTLAWDDFNCGYRELKFTIIHCEYDWTAGNLLVSDYLTGQDYENVEDYFPSTNTFKKYTNYRIVFPTDNLRPKLAGNYIVKVYDANDEKNIILTKRFYVTDNNIGITGYVKRPAQANLIKTSQEVVFNVDYQGLRIRNPMTDVQIVVQQNHRFDNEIRNIQPQFINNTVLSYDFDGLVVFPGYSEFRFIDLRSNKIPSLGVGSISLDSLYHFILLKEEDRSYLSYAQWKDINGKFIILGENNGYKPNELDYFSATFTLTTPYPDIEEVYLFGAMTDWKLDPKFKLTYSPQKKVYQVTSELKQGYYNYYYVIKNPQNGKIDCDRFQGSHYETENDYTVFVYYKSFFPDTWILGEIFESSSAPK